MTDAAAMSQLVDTTVERWGGLEVMVNNAGITRDATLRNLTMDDWQLVIQVHLTGTYLGIKEAARVMREAKWTRSSASTCARTWAIVRQADLRQPQRQRMMADEDTAQKDFPPRVTGSMPVQPGLLHPG